jgi:hypothetical protein
MTAAQLAASLKGTLAAYWRQRAALRLYSTYANHSDLQIERLEYDGVPEVGVASAFLQSETLLEAVTALEDYFKVRLAPDTFLALLSDFESFLVHHIQARGGSGTGTLGTLQRSLENLYTIPSYLVEEVDEIRQRRNILIHHGGQINAEYQRAAANVWQRSAGIIADPSSVTNLSVTPEYLSYVVNSLSQYATEVK